MDYVYLNDCPDLDEILAVTLRWVPAASTHPKALRKGTVHTGTHRHWDISSKEQRIPEKRYRAGIFKKSMGARNGGGIGLSYRPARLHRLAEFIPWNQFRGPTNI